MWGTPWRRKPAGQIGHRAAVSLHVLVQLKSAWVTSCGPASRLTLQIHGFAYTKAKFDDLPAAFPKQLKEAIGGG